MRLGDALKGFGESVVGAVKGSGAAPVVHEPGILSKAAGVAVSVIAAPFKGAAWLGGKTFKGGVKTGLYVAETPLVWATNSASWIVRKTGNFVHANKKLTIGAAAVAGVIGVGSWLSNRAEQRTQDDMMAQMSAIQQMQPPMQASANTFQGLAPGEYDAMVAPQMRGGEGMPRTDNTERLMAARQAAAAQPTATPETAAGL